MEAKLIRILFNRINHALKTSANYATEIWQKFERRTSRGMNDMTGLVARII